MSDAKADLLSECPLTFLEGKGRVEGIMSISCPFTSIIGGPVVNIRSTERLLFYLR